MARIKFTGYINVDDLEADQIDLDHISGLSAKGFDDLTGPDSRETIGTLEDIDVELQR